MGETRMSRTAAIDPRHGTETTIDSVGVGTIATTTTTRCTRTTTARDTIPRQPRFVDPRKVKNLPASWRVAYDELCRRMYGREPGAVDFAYHPGADAMLVRPFDYIGPRDQGWIEYRDPSDLAAFLGIGQLVKASVRRSSAKPKPTAQVAACPTVGAWLPTWAVEYLRRLVFAPKRDYAAAWIAHVVRGQEAPADPGAEWADKVRARVAKLARDAS